MMGIAWGFTPGTFDSHGTIFRAGEPGDSAYLVESGQVEGLLEMNGEFRRVDVMGPGAMFGEIALLDRLPRSGTVRTLEPTVLMRIDRSFVDELLRTTDPVIQYLMQLLLERIRRERSGKPGAGPLQGDQSPPTNASLTGLRKAQSPKVSSQLHSAAVRTLSLSRDLSEAIDGQQLELHYQPIGGQLAPPFRPSDAAQAIRR